MKIRKASYENMPVIANFIRSSASWYKPFLSEKDIKEHEVGQEWIEKNYKRREFYIGKDENGEDVGTISMQFFDKQTYLGYIYLDAKKTGKGYGKRLIKFAEEESKKRGQESLILIAHPKATWATKAYERFGFKKKFEKKENVVSYKDGLLEPYYEEGFHLYEYKLK
jgi:GNAT superfamily N-acetyltransferase